MSISKRHAILSSVESVGWVMLLHHFDTVTGDTPNCSANQTPVRFFSTNTNFSLFKSLLPMFNILKYYAKKTKKIGNKERNPGKHS